MELYMYRICFFFFKLFLKLLEMQSNILNEIEEKNIVIIIVNLEIMLKSSVKIKK